MKKNWLSGIVTAIENFIGLVAIFAIILVTFAVFSRSILNVSTAWTDEVLKICFIWLIFICAAVCYKSGGLIGLDLLEDKLSGKPKLQNGLRLLQSIVCALFGLFCTVQSFRIVSTQFSTGEATPIMSIPLWIVNLGFFIGSALILIYALQKMVTFGVVLVKKS